MTTEMRLIEDPTDLEELQLAVALSARPARVYGVRRSRQTWGGLYDTPFPQAFRVTRAEAARSVEGMREQGSTWIIDELLGCAFVAEDVTLLITGSMDRHSYSRHCKPYLRDIARCFSPVSTWRFIVRGKLRSASKRRLTSFTSWTFRTHSPLAWSRESPPRSLRRYRKARDDSDRSHISSIVKAYEESRISLPFFGVLYSAKKMGIAISRVHKLSPLRRLGIHADDIIGSLENQSLGKSWKHASEAALRRCRPGDELRLTVIRGLDRLQMTCRVQSLDQVVQSKKGHPG